MPHVVAQALLFACGSQDKESAHAALHKMLYEALQAGYVQRLVIYKGCNQWRYNTV